MLRSWNTEKKIRKIFILKETNEIGQLNSIKYPRLNFRLEKNVKDNGTTEKFDNDLWIT